VGFFGITLPKKMRPQNSIVVDSLTAGLRLWNGLLYWLVLWRRPGGTPKKKNPN
jgi:hypothetical protein